MRCNLCDSMDANIRPIELATARITLRAHVDCSGHGQYRSVSREEIKEATNRDARLLNAIPEMLELIQNVARTWEDDCQFIPCDTEAAAELGSKLSRLAAQATKLLAKIEGGGDAE